MNKPKHLHPLYVLFPMLNTLKSFAPIILLGGYKAITESWNRESGNDFSWIWLVLAAAVLLLLLILYGWLQWKRFVYVLEDDKILIQKGVISRDEISLYTGRIHSMNVEQPLVQRMLRLNQIRIETPGGSEKGTLLPALSNDAAKELQQWLRLRIAAGQARSDSHADENLQATVIPMHEDGAGYPKPSKEQEGSEHEQYAESNGLSNTEALQPVPDSMEASDPLIPMEERRILLKISSSKLLIAALSSLNLSLAAAFLAGIYSFADDILPERVYQTIFEGAGDLLPGGWFSLVVVGFIFAWLLSGVLYTIKYAGFTVEQIGKQFSITCGLLDRKQTVFSPERVQAVSVKEGLLRRLFGYGEVKLHVLTSEESKHLILHPLILIKDIPELIERMLPKFQAKTVTAVPPRRSRVLYIRWKLVFSAVLCTACIWYFHLPGLWSLLLIPLMLYWGFAEHRDTGFNISDKQLTIRTRSIALITYYIRRPQIVTVDISGTRRQRRKQLLSLEVSMITESANRIKGMEQSDVQAVWKWFSGSSRTSCSAATKPSSPAKS